MLRSAIFAGLLAHSDALTAGAWPAARVSGRGRLATSSLPDGLAARYAEIAAALPQQEQAYRDWLASGAVDCDGLRATAGSLGLTIDTEHGTLAYAPDFESKRVPLCFDLVYCRHGKTTGNTEPRVYQGYVDEPSNALNEIGRSQAEDAADKLDELGLAALVTRGCCRAGRLVPQLPVCACVCLSVRPRRRCSALARPGETVVHLWLQMQHGPATRALDTVRVG